MERHCMKLLEGWFGSYKHVFSELVGRAGTGLYPWSVFEDRGKIRRLGWKVEGMLYVIMEDLGGREWSKVEVNCEKSKCKRVKWDDSAAESRAEESLQRPSFS